MAVLPQTPDVADDPGDDIAVELAWLRRRAYGPGADIQADAAAQTRLRELEERARGVGAGADAPESEVEKTPGLTPPVIPEVTGGHVAVSDGSARADAETDTDTDTGTDTEARESRGSGFLRRARPVVRDRRTWAIAGVGALFGAAVTAGFLTAPWSGPNQVLHVDPDASPINTSDYREWLPPLGVDLDSARVFETVSGFTPWVVDMKDGGRCLLLSQGEGTGILNIACAGDGVDPTMDVLPGMWGMDDARQGATIRLVARDATVEVWFGGPQPTTDSAASRPVS